MYFPEGFDCQAALLLTELVGTAYDMQSQWKQQGKPRRDAFRWSPKGPSTLQYSQPLWGADRFFYFFQTDEPYAFVATGPDQVAYLVFRGTDSDADWVENLKFDQEDYSPVKGYGKTNLGFTEIYCSMRQAILDTLASIDPPQTLWITGHSLGSALSTLAVPDLCANGVRPDGFRMVHINFASPRTGDPVFANAYDACGVPTYRLVNTCDIVPTVPASVVTSDLPIYKHVGVPVDFSAQYGSIPANHDVSNSYGYALAHPQEPESAAAEAG